MSKRVLLSQVKSISLNCKKIFKYINSTLDDYILSEEEKKLIWLWNEGYMPNIIKMSLSFKEGKDSSTWEEYLIKEDTFIDNIMFRFKLNKEVKTSN